MIENNVLREASSRFCQKVAHLSNGKIVAYREAQHNIKQTCVIIHGLTGTSYSMLLLADAYRKHGWRVVVLDLPGHGDSSTIPARNMNDLADWLHETLQLVCPNPAIIVGNSFGSSVVLAYIQKYQISLTTRIILSAPIPVFHPILQVIDRVFACTPDTIARRIYYTNRLLLGFRTNFLLARRDRFDYRQIVAECIATEGPQVHHQYAEMVLMKANLHSNPFSKPLPRYLLSQVVVVYGDTDRLAGERAMNYLQKWAAKLRIIEIAQCGHLVHIEGITEIVKIFN